jgi:hypothetical protein
MLKKIAISALFVVGVMFAGVRGVAAKASGGKAVKVDVVQKAQGICPYGVKC